MEHAKALADADYAAIDAALGKSGKSSRWSRNALNRPGMLPVKTARLLMKWAEGVTAEHGDKKSLAQMRLVAFQLREYDPVARPVPMLVLGRHVDEVSAAFDAYLRRHGAASAARGLLRDFLMQSTLLHERGESRTHRPSIGPEQTYARSCAWDLSIRIEKLAAKKWASLTYRDDLRLTPADLRSVIYGLEGWLDLDRLENARAHRRRRV